MERTALIVGASGLIGGYLVRSLLEDEEYQHVIVLTRRELALQHYKLEKRIVDFEGMEKTLKGLKVHDAFCTLGTTIRKAGSPVAFRKVDFEYPVRTATVALKAGAQRFLAVTSLGADATSSNLYLRTKGELEQALRVEGFKGLILFRPSILLGERHEFRLGEKFGIAALKLASPFMRGRLKKYKPIQASTVAAAMVAAAKQNIRGVQIFESNEIAELATAARNNE